MENNSIFKSIEDILRGKTGRNLEIGILTAENEMGKQLPDAINNKRNELMYKKLTQLGAKVFRIQGNFEGINENSFLVTGVPLEKMKELSLQFKQKAFIYGNGTDDDMIFHYMELISEDSEEPDYESTQIRRTFVYKPNAKENYSLYKGVKFVIPFFDNDYSDVHWEELSDEERGEIPEKEISKEKPVKESMTKINRIKSLIESLKIDEKAKVKIKVKHADLLEIPEGKKFWNMPFKHYTELVNKKGYAKVVRALNNLKTWNKKDDPSIAEKADALMDKLKSKFRPEEG